MQWRPTVIVCRDGVSALAIFAIQQLKYPDMPIYFRELSRRPIALVFRRAVGAPFEQNFDDHFVPAYRREMKGCPIDSIVLRVDCRATMDQKFD